MKTDNNDAGKDRRRQPRIGYDMPIEYTLSVLEFGDLKDLELAGTAVDRTEEGLGFFTPYRLYAGNVIRIKDTEGTYRLAVVRWVAELDGEFRVGVLFYK